MDLYLAIRLKAFLAVTKPDKPYLVRKTIRWYSKTFSTPIKVVEGLPLEEVFQAFYEEHYEEMDSEARESEKEDLLLSDEDRYRRMLEAEAEEAESFDCARFIAEDERRQKKEATLKSESKKLGSIVPGGVTAGAPIVATEAGVKIQDLPKAMPPAITMNFMDADEFEDELEGFGSMKQPEKP